MRDRCPLLAQSGHTLLHCMSPLGLVSLRRDKRIWFFVRFRRCCCSSECGTRGPPPSTSCAEIQNDPWRDRWRRFVGPEHRLCIAECPPAGVEFKPVSTPTVEGGKNV